MGSCHGEDAGEVSVGTDARGSIVAWNSVAWSPDDKQIAAGSSGQITVLDAATATHVSYYGTAGPLIHVVAWSPDGKYLAAGYANSLVEVWNTTNHSETYTYNGHHSDV